jgi:N-acetylglutamate synthase-like GNAT family acetyltransferase
MSFIKVPPDSNLSTIINVLNESHLTVAKEFRFSKLDNPTNNAFIDAVSLRTQLEKGIELYQLMLDDKVVGCIAIEKSIKEADTFYIEKVSVVPDHRHKGFGLKLMKFALDEIKNRGGKCASIALIDSNLKLKIWYLKQGFIETGTKDFAHLPFKVCFMIKQI